MFVFFIEPLHVSARLRTVFTGAVHAGVRNASTPMPGCYLRALMMEAARTSETSVDIQLRTRQYIPEDSELHTRRRENLKSHTT
jgi:hypothetical protein